MTSSCHRCHGLPAGLLPIGLHSNSFLVGLAWSIRFICPFQLIICALMNLIISAPCINLSIAMLFRIFLILVGYEKKKGMPHVASNESENHS